MINVIEIFRELLKINSPSEKEGEIIRFLEEKLKTLGLSVEIENNNIVAKLEGIGEPLMLAAHTDTAESTEGLEVVQEGNVIKTNGKTILGADDKAGIAIMLALLSEIKEKNLKTYPLEIVLTSEEESGLVGAQKLDYSKIKSKVGLALDGDGEIGGCTTRAPGYIRLDMEIIGKAAHSGAEPEKGINAIKIAGIALSKVKLGILDELSTANFGMISGGTARNIVPERVTLNGEVRSADSEKLKTHSENIIKIFEETVKENNAKLVINSELEFEGYELNKDDETLKIFEKCCQLTGVKFNPAPSGGGSDANIFNANGIKVLDISVGYMNPHTKEEHISTTSLEKALELVINFVKV